MTEEIRVPFATSCGADRELVYDPVLNWIETASYEGCRCVSVDCAPEDLDALIAALTTVREQRQRQAEGAGHES